MTASHFWIGVECMPASVVQDAASHPRPILCGNLADAADMRSALAKSLEQAEWHDLALASPIGQGYLLDLLRQRGPIEHIVLALPAISCARIETGDDGSRSLDPQRYLFELGGEVRCEGRDGWPGEHQSGWQAESEDVLQSVAKLQSQQGVEAHGP